MPESSFFDSEADKVTFAARPDRRIYKLDDLLEHFLS